MFAVGFYPLVVATLVLSASYLLSSVLAGCLKAAKESRGLKAVIQEAQNLEGNMPIRTFAP